MAEPLEPAPDQFAIILGALADGITVQDRTGRLVYANDAAAQICGYPSAEVLLATPPREVLAHFEIVDDAGHPFPLEALPGRRVLDGAPEASATLGYRVRASGAECWTLVKARPVRDATGVATLAINVLHDITERKHAEIERAALLAEAQAARASAEAAEQRLTFLAAASGLLAASLDYETTLARVARLAVPQIADWCAVDVAGPDGRLERLAVAHVDPAKVEWAWELHRRYPPDPAAPGGPYQVLRTGQPAFYPEITDAMLVASAQDPDQLQLNRAIGFTSAIQVPLLVHGQALGILTLVSAESGRHYTADDLALADDLARRAAMAIENARLYREMSMERGRFQVTLASIGDAVIATDTAGRVTFLNPVAEVLTGWDLDAATGQPLPHVFRIVNEKTGQAVEDPVSRVIREGSVVGLANHTQLIARDGSAHPIADSGAPIRDAQGELIGVVLVFRDISAQQEAEAQLHETEARFRMLANTAPVLIWMAGLDMLCTFFNKPWLEFTGRTLGQELGAGWTEGVHPEDIARYLGAYQSAFAARRPFQVEYRLRRADGVYRWLLNTAVPRQEPEGHFAGYIGSCIDITERRQEEDRRRFLAEVGTILGASLDYETTLNSVARLAIPVIADNCVVDLVEPGGTIRRVALAAADPVQEARLRNLQHHYPPDPRGLGLALVLESRRPIVVPVVTDEARQAVARDATHLALLREFGTTSFIVVPFLARGRALGTLGVGMAESHRHYEPADLALVEELARRAALALDNAMLYDEAQRAIQVRDQFLLVASHELKTPLTSVLAAAQLLQRRAEREGILNERDQRAVRLVSEQAARLNRMVLSLLDLGRIETGQLSIERNPVDLGALVARLVDDALPTVERHHLQLQMPATPLIVTGDALRLEQVLQNLIGNAVKYSPAGGEIGVQVEARGAWVCVQVRDAGIGIPPAAQARLFSRFYRAPNAEAQGISGLGIGLYVVKEIVALHGGTVDVASAEGAGSTFTICIPAA